MRRTSVKQISLRLSSGLLSTATDVTLFTFYLTLATFGKQPTYTGYDHAFREAHKMLDQVNYKTLTHALSRLRKNGLVSYQKKQMKKSLTITTKGKAYLHSLLPSYKKTRFWDRHIYLITYDVPETQKRDRERLRKYIRGLGAGMLQDSVWVMFKNPKQLLQTFIEEKGLSGVVIISNMGQDATIGDEDLSSLINRIYGLNKLNVRYELFIRQCSIPKLSRLFVASSYLSILKEDPQLPFELLPENWQGEKALKLYQKLISR